MEKESDTQKEAEREREGKIAYSFLNKEKEEKNQIKKIKDPE